MAPHRHLPVPRLVVRLLLVFRLRLVVLRTAHATSGVASDWTGAPLLVGLPRGKYLLSCRKGYSQRCQLISAKASTRVQAPAKKSNWPGSRHPKTLPN